MADKKKNRYRNPANDLVDYAEGGIRNALLGIRNSAASSLRGSAAAARRTKERLEREAANDRSLKAEVVRKNQPTPPKKIDASKYDMDSEPPKPPSKENPKPAEVKPAKTPVRGSEQRTTNTSSSTTRKSAPAKRDTRNDEYNRLRIKANKSGNAEDRKAAESEGMKAWRKANPKLAAELDRKEAEKRRKRDNGKSGAVRAGWDGNKNY